MNGDLIPCPVNRWADETPEAPAVFTGEKTYSYRQLDNLVWWFANEFLENGIGEGNRVGLQIENSVDLIARLCAAWRVGAIAVPLNMRFPQDYIKEVFHRLNITHYVMLQPVRPLEGLPEYGWPEGVAIPLDNEATIILTSGSTGREKAVLHSYANHYYNALGSNTNIRLGRGDRWLLSLPLCHVGGLGILFRTLLSGAAMVIPGSDETPAESIYKHRVTHVSLVSTQLRRMLEKLEPGRDGGKPEELSSLKAVLLGGSAFPGPLIGKALSFGLPVYTTYGMSEMASQVTTTPPDAPPDKLLTSGKVLKHRDIRISANGEISVSGAVCFKGYVEEESQLVRPFDGDGWFATGDLGRLDGEGYLHVSGRLDNMFISGGENIMPEEIEAYLDRLPGVEQSMVVPVSSTEYGFRPVAFLKTRRPSALEKEAVMEYLQRLLPRFKIPDRFYLWPGMEIEEHEPASGSLKVKRSDFIEQARNGDGLTLLFKK